VLALGAAACGSDDDGGSADTTAAAAVTEAPATTVAATTEAPTTTTPGVAGDITVFAAASLTEAFTEVGEAFTAANPDAKATFTFDASSALVQQITEGAPADVFASADTANMDKLTDAGLNGNEPVIFATNLLAIIVAPDNPLGITGVEDLENPDLKVVVCAEEVPCGRYAKQIFDNAGVTVTPVSLEQNVNHLNKTMRVAFEPVDWGAPRLIRPIFRWPTEAPIGIRSLKTRSLSGTSRWIACNSVGPWRGPAPRRVQAMV
jgi:molybdate transport system substrate-binding protein